MGKKSTKNKFWFKLIYFRWKALIRSKAYLDFYNEKVKPLIEEKAKTYADRDSLLKVAFTPESYLNSFTKVLKEYIQLSGLVPLNGEAVSEMIFPGEIELMEEAKKRFNLLVNWIGLLEPMDIDISENKDLWLTFTEYLPLMPDDHQQRKHAEEFIFAPVTEITDEDDFNLKEYREVYPDRRIFAIETDTPFEMILNELNKHLGYSNGRAIRKQFDDWDEYFKVWDIRQNVQGEEEDYYRLEVGRHMFQVTGKAEWEASDLETKQRVKQRVGHAIKRAQELIDLAGQGKFVKL